MARVGEADPSALSERRLGRSAEELGHHVAATGHTNIISVPAVSGKLADHTGGTTGIEPTPDPMAADSECSTWLAHMTTALHMPYLILAEPRSRLHIMNLLP